MSKFLTFLMGISLFAASLDMCSMRSMSMTHRNHGDYMSNTSEENTLPIIGTETDEYLEIIFPSNQNLRNMTECMAYTKAFLANIDLWVGKHYAFANVNDWGDGKAGRKVSIKLFKKESAMWIILAWDHSRVGMS